MLADRLADLELGDVGLGSLREGALCHALAGGDVVGVAQQLGELDPGGDLVGGRFLGQLGRADAQLCRLRR